MKKGGIVTSTYETMDRPEIGEGEIVIPVIKPTITFDVMTSRYLLSYAGIQHDITDGMNVIIAKETALIRNELREAEAARDQADRYFERLNAEHVEDLVNLEQAEAALKLIAGEPSLVCPNCGSSEVYFERCGPQKYVCQECEHEVDEGEFKVAAVFAALKARADSAETRLAAVVGALDEIFSHIEWIDGKGSSIRKVAVIPQGLTRQCNLEKAIENAYVAVHDAALTATPPAADALKCSGCDGRGFVETIGGHPAR